ncbi:hypothetical protein PsorP6_008364 [Peronosclerospora sorghi]|uniref:Uncharacterized protein n=1 Tax=Peronosclerospora sorghi TaxID=230839 RepID=A0ACC0W940_9STRA|nr:hypothetical protein PsorP6_008364 [Peronosclerospora sorghi]
MSSVHETHAATLVEWLQRLKRAHASDIKYLAKESLAIYVLGADYREGNTEAATFEAFRKLAQYIATQRQFSSLSLVLVGPNLSRKLHCQKFSQNFYFKDEADASSSTCQVDVTYFVGSFEAYFRDQRLYSPADLVVCFNAGIWGYDEWLPAIRLVLKVMQVPLLVTSYNEHEAGDDEDVLDALMPFQWLWRPEKNPMGAITPRATSNDNGHILKENDFWMCLTGRSQ